MNRAESRWPTAALLVAACALPPRSAAAQPPPDGGDNAGWRSLDIATIDRPGRANPAAAERPDGLGPRLIHTPLTRSPAGAPLPLRVEASDPSGIAEVWLRYRAGGDELARVPMTAGEDAVYRATIDTAGLADGLFEYSVVATDGRGNASRLGSEEQPLRTELYATATLADTAPDGPDQRYAALALLVGVIALLGFGRGRSARQKTQHDRQLRQEQELQGAKFWEGLLRPFLGLPMDEQIDAMRVLSARTLRHPVLGSRKFSTQFLLDRLQEVQAKQPQVRPRPSPAEQRQPDATAAESTAPVVPVSNGTEPPDDEELERLRELPTQPLPAPQAPQPPQPPQPLVELAVALEASLDRDDAEQVAEDLSGVLTRSNPAFQAARAGAELGDTAGDGDLDDEDVAVLFRSLGLVSDTPPVETDSATP